MTQVIKTLKMECGDCGLLNGHRYPCTDATETPVLSEGGVYELEIASAEQVVKAKLLRIVDDLPGLCGLSFQIGKRKQFIALKDLIFSNGYLIAMI